MVSLAPRRAAQRVAAALLAASCIAGSAVHADPPLPSEGESRLNWAREQAAAAQQKQRRMTAEQLAELVAEFEQLSARLGSSHPRLQQIERQIEAIRRAPALQPGEGREDASEHQRELRQLGWQPQPVGQLVPASGAAAQDGPARVAARDLQPNQRLRHAREAIEHLRSAGMHDLADLVRVRAEQTVRDRPRDQPRQWQGGPGDSARADQAGPPSEIHRIVERLGRAVENIERRVSESEEIRQAVADVQRHVGRLQREIDDRLSDIEQQLHRQAQHAERMVGERSGQVERAIETVERHVNRAISELESRLAELHEHLEEEHQDEEIP